MHTDELGAYSVLGLGRRARCNAIAHRNVRYLGLLGLRPVESVESG